MRKIMKNSVFTFILGMIVMGSIGVVAYAMNAKQIAYEPSDNTWNVSNVSDAIDSIKEDGVYKKVCEKVSGTSLAIGSKYECDPGDGTTRNFYILEVRADSVDLIMDRNISSGTMTWNNAMKYIKNNNLKTTWKDVEKVDLPSAQAIADAVGNSSWRAEDVAPTSSTDNIWWCFASKTQDSQSAPYCNTSQASAYNWLYDYTRACNGCSHSLTDTDGQPNGYWTRDMVNKSSKVWNLSSAWLVNKSGGLSRNTVSNATDYGVRPVITLSKSNMK